MGRARRLKNLTKTDVEAISRRLFRSLGERAKGRFVAIDMQSGVPYFGDSTLAAVEHGLRVAPRARFFIQRLGYPVAATLKRKR